MKAWLVLLGSAVLACGQQKSFPTARDAAKALLEAVRADDTAALLSILGPHAKELVSSGDDVADKNDRAGFAKAYGRGHKFVAAGPGRYTLLVGSSDWPLPIPIVKGADGWTFDSSAGKEELLYRRIGQNDLDAIRVCRAMVEAGHEYARSGHDGNPPGIYTRRVRSEDGKQNGLYWDTPEDTAASRGGPLLAEADSDGYELGKVRHQPFYGYLYRIIKAQGPHAHGGARDYVVDGKMTGGFAIVAYPVEYRSSGVMTFITNRRGIVYQKDLGEDTKTEARAITEFDPDSSWKVVQ